MAAIYNSLVFFLGSVYVFPLLGALCKDFERRMIPCSSTAGIGHLSQLPLSRVLLLRFVVLAWELPTEEPASRHPGTFSSPSFERSSLSYKVFRTHDDSTHQKLKSHQPFPYSAPLFFRNPPMPSRFPQRFFWRLVVGVQLFLFSPLLPCVLFAQKGLVNKLYRRACFFPHIVSIFPSFVCLVRRLTLTIIFDSTLTRSLKIRIPPSQPRVNAPTSH